MRKAEMFFAMRELVRDCLLTPHARVWTVQGFGMFRCYFGPADDPKQYRLNLWDSRFKVPGVSTVHDHPWHFNSWIMGGNFTNVRYRLGTIDYASVGRPAVSAAGWTHHGTTIKTGEGGGPDGSLTFNCYLHRLQPEMYSAGDHYEQNADEIHESFYDDGTVTLNKRTRVGDGEHARVFWPFGQEWVDAKPRRATTAEINDAISLALKKWF